MEPELEMIYRISLSKRFILLRVDKPNSVKNVLKLNSIYQRTMRSKRDGEGPNAGNEVSERTAQVGSWCFAQPPPCSYSRFFTNVGTRGMV